MKTLILILTLLGAQAAFGIVVVSPPTSTNGLAAWQANQQQIREIAQRNFASGELVELQRQADRLEIEVALLAVAVGALAAIQIMLLRRDRVPKTRPVQEPAANGFHANQ